MAITINRKEIQISLLYLLILCRYLLPYYFMDNTEGIISRFPIVDYSLLAVSTLLMVTQLVFGGFRLSRTDLFVILVYAFLVLSTILNHGEILACLINAVQVILICFVLKDALQDETKKWVLIRLIRNITLVIFIANIIATFLFPSGVPYSIKHEDPPYFLYGNVNTTIKFLFPGLLCSFILDIKRHKTVSISTGVFYVGYLYLCFHIYLMATGFCAMLFVLLWKLNRQIITKNIRLICTVVISVIILFELSILVFTNQGLINSVLSLFGKAPGFTGRDYLWHNCIRCIKERIVLGHGIIPSSRLEAMVGNPSGSHNYYLDLLFQRGVIGFVPFLLFIIVPIFKPGQRTYSKEHYILSGFAIAYLIMFMFEPFYAVERFHIPVFYVLNLLTERVPSITPGRIGGRISPEPAPADAFCGKSVVAGD